MKVAIEVNNRSEAESVKRAMADPKCRALVLIVGALLELPSDRARLRVLRHVQDALDEGELARLSTTMEGAMIP